MADTQRTRAALQALLADNVTGQISPQDLRDFLVTVMNPEFVNVGDFWHQPDPQQMTSDRTVRGWVDYSQLISEACSFGDILIRGASGAWTLASAVGVGALGYSQMAVIGMAAESYLASTVGNVLRKGLAKCAACSTVWSEGIGRFMYLDSGAAGKLSVWSGALPSVTMMVGYPELEGSAFTTSLTDVFRFDPGWAAIEDF
jgi:hypothetical protein